MKASGHIDETPNAEVNFGTLSTTGEVSPVFTSELTCQNTYCHGEFSAGDQDNEPKWTVVDGTQADCGTCHGLPPTGPTRNIGFTHSESLTNCSQCHGSIVDENNNIIDKTKHINGVVEGTAHPNGWTEFNDSNFHGIYLQNNNWNIIDCTECHGTDYAGGISGESCNTCHTGTPEDCSNCHGQSADPTGAPPKDLLGNTETTNRGVGAHTTHLSANQKSANIACSECHTVPSGFSSTGHTDTALPAELTWGMLAASGGVSPGFTADLKCMNTYCHGNFAAGNKSNMPGWTVVDGTQSACGTCHTLPPTGATRNLGLNHNPAITDCSRCHTKVVDNLYNFIDKTRHVNGIVNVDAHPNGWLNPSDAVNFHGKFLETNQWNLSYCADCHGSDYAGGSTGVSCNNCHQGTPEACTTCHGQSSDPTGMPPRDIAGNTATTNRGVGAHATHQSGGQFSASVACIECHSVPDIYAATGHADTALPAELTWGTITLTGGATPSFTGSLTCESTYCHGNFGAGNKSNAPSWTTVDGTQATCGSCHALPPVGQSRNIQFEHQPVMTDCATCHVAVIDVNNNIINKSLHINGDVNF
jgi:predicted CxxxxCH...CXXCH cytochrome family protein